MSALYLDDLEVRETYGLIVGQEVSGHRDGPAVQAASIDVLGRLGQTFLSDRPRTQPRSISVPCVQVADTVTALNALKDRLKFAVYRRVRVRFGDLPDREFECYGQLKIIPIGSWLDQEAHTVILSFVAADPVTEAVESTVVNLSTTPAECPLGSAVSMPVIRVGGSVTNPVVTVTDHLGRTVGSMGFTHTLGASDYLEVDCEAKTIYDAAENPHHDKLTSGTFIQLNPQDGAGLDGPFPRLQISAGTIGEAEYRKRWL